MISTINQGLSFGLIVKSIYKSHIKQGEFMKLIFIRLGLVVLASLATTYSFFTNEVLNKFFFNLSIRESDISLSKVMGYLVVGSCLYFATRSKEKLTKEFNLK